MAGADLVTILFTDLVGSTATLARLGEEAAEELRQAHFAILREAIAQSAGREVKNLGDGLMAVFDTASEAIGCGSEVDDGAGQGAGDPVRELQSGDHHLAQVVDGFGLDLDDHVIGAGDVGGGDDPLEPRNLGGHMSRPAHLGLDEHIRPDGHEASSRPAWPAQPMVAIPLGVS
jgi:class 3 adenylate cyclase